LIKSLETDNVKLLADLFHMNIEETNLASAILSGKGFIGHVHFVDSNRWPAGFGHIDFAPVASALYEIAYDRYASVEAFPYPDSNAAAQQTIETFRSLFPR
jgi:sugar phosphate isomerase/epimerase